VHDGLRARIVESRVPDLVAEQVRVEVLERADLAFLPELIFDRDLLEVDVAVEVHGVPTAKAQPERRVVSVVSPTSVSCSYSIWHSQRRRRSS